MQGENPRAQRKDIIAYNMALASGNLNITLMEAMHSLAVRKEQMRVLGRRYLLGRLTAEEQTENPLIKEKAWAESVDKKIASLKERHSDAMTQMNMEAEEKERTLRNEITTYKARIDELKDKLNTTSQYMKANKVPEFDIRAVGDTNKLKRNVNALKETIARMERDLKGKERENMMMSGWV